MAVHECNAVEALHREEVEPRHYTRHQRRPRPGHRVIELDGSFNCRKTSVASHALLCFDLDRLLREDPHTGQRDLTFCGIIAKSSRCEGGEVALRRTRGAAFLHQHEKRFPRTRRGILRVAHDGARDHRHNLVTRGGHDLVVPPFEEEVVCVVHHAITHGPAVLCTALTGHVEPAVVRKRVTFGEVPDVDSQHQRNTRCS